MTTSVRPSIGQTVYAVGVIPDSSRAARFVRQTPVWVPITPKTGSLFHADQQFTSLGG